MITQLENISETKKKIKVTVTQDAIKSCLSRAYQKVSQKAKINGFRPGKIPIPVLDQHYKSEIDFECLNFILADSYTHALAEHKLVPMTRPQFDTAPLNRDADYAYSVVVEVKPQFELKNYKGLEIKKLNAEFTEDELQAELKRLQESLAQLAPAPDDETLKLGLVATIDFDGKIDGKTFKGGSAKDYVFEFGTGILLKDFEEKINGLKKGETRDIDITFPADYFEKDLAGQNATYKISLKNLYLKSLPNIDDELAKDIGKENLEQVKNEIKDAVLKRKERGFRRDYAKAVRQKLIADYKFEIPQSLVDHEVEHQKRERQEVEDQIRFEIILEAIATTETVRVNQDDVERRMTALSQIYRQPISEVRKLYLSQDRLSQLISQITIDKTVDFIIDNAKMT